MTENLITTPSSKTAITIFKDEMVVKKFDEILWKRATAFLTTVMGIVANSDGLKNADPNSVYMCALVSATLDLPINPNLWFAYIVPYNDKSWKQLAQFQMWYKGYIQLSLRSWQFKTIWVWPIYKWQIISENPIFWYEFDFKNKESQEIIGYASWFKLINWFEKVLYMPKEILENHANQYSFQFKKYKNWLWKDKFDEMSSKTVIKLLLSKRAPLSVEMQKAVLVDQWVIKDEEFTNIDYIDNNENEINNVDLDEKLKELKPLNNNENT